MSVAVPAGATILEVKNRLVSADPTGALRADAFGLAPLGAAGSGGAAPLPDATRVDAGHTRLETVEVPEVSKVSKPVATAAPPKEEAAEAFPTAQPAPRPKDAAAQKPPSGPCWEVVGGTAQGGILVREGRSTTSTQLAERLATGAVVEELGREGERLHYRRIGGAGPEIGWVSVSISGKDLLVPRQLSAEELFTLDRALSLQEDLMEGFSKPDFQRALRRIIQEHPNKTGTPFLRQRGELFLTVQSVVLPRYGFEGAPPGILRMMTAFGRHQGSGEVAWNNEQLNKLLQM